MMNGSRGAGRRHLPRRRVELRVGLRGSAGRRSGIASRREGRGPEKICKGDSDVPRDALAGRWGQWCDSGTCTRSSGHVPALPS